MIRSLLFLCALFAPLTSACAGTGKSLEAAIKVSEIEITMGEFEREDPRSPWVTFDERQAWRIPFDELQDRGFAEFAQSQRVPLLMSLFHIFRWYGTSAVTPDAALYFAVQVDAFKDKNISSGGSLKVCRIEFFPDKMPEGQMLQHMLTIEALLSGETCSLEGLKGPRFLKWSNTEIESTPTKTIAERPYGDGAKVRFVEPQDISQEIDTLEAAVALLDGKPIRQFAFIDSGSLLLQASDGTFVLGHSEQIPGFDPPGWRDDHGACLMITTNWADIVTKTPAYDAPNRFETSIDHKEELKSFCDQWQKDHAERLQEFWDKRVEQILPLIRRGNPDRER